MPGHRPSISRPRPSGAHFRGPRPGGEGGNRSSWVAAALNPSTLLAAALVVSAAFVGIATAVIY